MSPIANSQNEFLHDLAAVTGGKVLDGINAPLEYALITDLGNVSVESNMVTEDGREMPIYGAAKVSSFESGRYRSSIHGFVSEDLLIVRADEVRIQSEQAASQLDREFLRERLAKLTGGIARLIVVGSGSGEIRERKDRAEDAICAVRGALRRGCLVGGGWTLLKIIDTLPDTKICGEVIKPALFAPVQLLCINSGISATEIDAVISEMGAGSLRDKPQVEARVRDASTGEFVRGVDAGILDSFPAVHEAIKNAIGIAGVLGTTGGIVVHPRDHDAELAEARDRAEFNRMIKEFDPNRN
jgi:chaperonin GroEL